MSTTAVVPPVRPVPRSGRQRREAPRRPVRLTRRGRVVLVGFFLSVSLGVSFLVLRDTSDATDRSGTLHYRTVTVAPGQSLWDIARRAAPGEDPRDTIARIVQFNALPGAVVQPGQRIAIPDSG